MSQPLPPGYGVNEVDTSGVVGNNTAAPTHGNEYGVTERDTTAMGAGDDTAGAGAPEFSSGNHTTIPDTGSGFGHVNRDTEAAEGGPGTHYQTLSGPEGPGAFVQNFNQGTEDTTQPGPPLPSNKADLDAAAAAHPDLVMDNAYRPPNDKQGYVNNDLMDTWGTAAGGGPAAQGAAMYSSETGLYGPDKDVTVQQSSYDASRQFQSGYDENPDLGPQYVSNVAGTLNETAPPAPAVTAVTADPLGQRLDVTFTLAGGYTGSKVTGVEVYVYRCDAAGHPAAWPTATRSAPLGAPVVIDRLEPEVSYRVAVAAKNVNGEGARSALSAPVRVLRTHGL